MALVKSQGRIAVFLGARNEIKQLLLCEISCSHGGEHEDVSTSETSVYFNETTRRCHLKLLDSHWRR
jgi:hypothetical protein